MKLIKSLIIIGMTITASTSGPHDPFPLGCSMMSQGALVDVEDVSGRQPWIPAAYYLDSLRWGAAVAAVSYHGGGSASRYAVGGFGVVGPVTVKTSLTQLDVMGVYYEQTAALSAGSRWRFLSFSLDAQLYRAGVYGSQTDARSIAAIGASILALPGRGISVDVSAEGFGALIGGLPAPGAEAAPSITARVCTVRNRYGSQGAAVRITPDSESPVRFILAQEYRIGRYFAFSASIASNPTMIGFGVTAGRPALTASASAVNHPYLGWSKGVSADYAR